MKLKTVGAGWAFYYTKGEVRDCVPESRRPLRRNTNSGVFIRTDDGDVDESGTASTTAMRGPNLGDPPG